MTIGAAVSEGVETRTLPVSNGRELCAEMAGDDQLRPPRLRRLDRRPWSQCGVGSAGCPRHRRGAQHDRLGIWGISGGGPYALACAALLPDLAVAVGAVASLAPYGEEGFDYFAGTGELNAEDFKLFFSDPEAARRRHHEDWEEARAATPEQLAEIMKSVLAPTDAEAMTGDLAEWLAVSARDGLAAGDQGWWDDGASQLTDWDSTSKTSGCRSRSGTAAMIGPFRCSTVSGWPRTYLARRLRSVTTTAI